MTLAGVCVVYCVRLRDISWSVRVWHLVRKCTRKCAIKLSSYDSTYKYLKWDKGTTVEFETAWLLRFAKI